jgi:phospholipase D-like protein
LVDARLQFRMSEFLNRFSFSSAQSSTEIAICTGVLWALMVWCAITSIRAQPFNMTTRRFWIVVVIAVPILGLLAYLPFSLTRERRSL